MWAAHLINAFVVIKEFESEKSGAPQPDAESLKVSCPTEIVDFMGIVGFDTRSIRIAESIVVRQVKIIGPGSASCLKSGG